MKQLKVLVMPYGKLSINYNKSDPTRPIYERFAKGSLKESVAAINSGSQQIEANLEHAQDNATTRIALSNKNMTLSEDDTGVYATINLGDDTLSEDVWKRAKAGIADGASIEFSKNSQQEINHYGNTTIITRTKAVMTGLGIVAKGAFPDAKVEAVETADDRLVLTRSISDKEIEAIEKEVDLYNRIQIHEYYAALLQK